VLPDCPGGGVPGVCSGVSSLCPGVLPVVPGVVCDSTGLKNVGIAANVITAVERLLKSFLSSLVFRPFYYTIIPVLS
jgi:hypothetical protein